MKNITCLSDTHNLHRQVVLESGDFLFHCGDVTEWGTEEELVDFLEWFAEQDYQHKIFIGGNHDLILEELTPKQLKKLIPKGVTYLQNEFVELGGLKLFGSPNTEETLGMAFGKNIDELEKIYSKIPSDLDFLLTHEAPFGLNDRNQGSKVLLKHSQRKKPTFHLYGHKHGAYGFCIENGTEYINCALCSEPYYMSDESLKLICAAVVMRVEM